MKNARPVVVLAHPLVPEVVSALLEPRCRLIRVRTRAELARAVPGADALIVTLLDRVDERLLARASSLRVVGNCAVGVNNIDLAACAERRIQVVNTPDVLTRATAELAVCLLLAAARRLPEGEALCRSGRFRGWAPDLLLGLELRGRRAVIVGRGRIGRETASLFRALGLRVELVTRKTSAVGIRKALARAQVLSLHAPLTSRTRHWLGASRLRLLPSDAIVINTSRGPLIDEAALARALRDRRIFAAGLDVYEHEPRIHPLLRKLPNVVLLPHLGSATRLTRARMTELVIQGVLGVLDGKAPWNTVKLQGK